MEYISPDGKWKITIRPGKAVWTDLTKNSSSYTIKELVEATKAIAPEIWKK